MWEIINPSKSTTDMKQWQVLDSNHFGATLRSKMSRFCFPNSRIKIILVDVQEKSNYLLAGSTRVVLTAMAR
jgi:hypothetical protein